MSRRQLKNHFIDKVTLFACISDQFLSSCITGKCWGNLLCNPFSVVTLGSHVPINGFTSFAGSVVT